MTHDPSIRTLDDARALKALAHPLRLDLLEAVSLHGPLTATAAAEYVGESPANCSWHLRQLAKYGFIEPVPDVPGRERPWRRVDRGMEWHSSQTDPAVNAASLALTEVFIDREVRLVKTALASPQPEGWQDSPVATLSVLWMTREELETFGEQILEVLSAYRGRIDDPARRPEGARPVRMIALAAPDDTLVTPEPDDSSGDFDA